MLNENSFFIYNKVENGKMSKQQSFKLLICIWNYNKRRRRVSFDISIGEKYHLSTIESKQCNKAEFWVPLDSVLEFIGSFANTLFVI